MQPFVRQVGSLIFRERAAQGAGRHPLQLLLHGWTGDENSMWVFSARLPKDTWLVAPHGLYPAPLGGYSWSSPQVRRTWPELRCFSPGGRGAGRMPHTRNFPGADLVEIDVIGFSQGAALAYAFALLHPERVRALVGLAGFLPDGVAAFLGSSQPLRRQPALPVFIAHGTQDELVPVTLARRSVEMLQQAGAEVTYCEDEVGHKLSADCFCGLEDFFVRLRTPSSRSI